MFMSNEAQLGMKVTHTREEGIIMLNQEQNIKHDLLFWNGKL